jgi:hypothetical protein
LLLPVSIIFGFNDEYLPQETEPKIIPHKGELPPALLDATLDSKNVTSDSGVQGFLASIMLFYRLQNLCVNIAVKGFKVLFRDTLAVTFNAITDILGFDIV